MIEVLGPGPLATVQDLGRFGHRGLGVGSSGAADQSSHRLANRLVGNDVGAATIEVTFGGLHVRLLVPATVALTGARCTLGGRVTLPWATPLSLPAGAELVLAAPVHGLRSYLAVRGGIDVAPTLGSRSTDTLSGLGPAPLTAGDRLPVGGAVAADPIEIPTEPASPNAPIEVWPGPRLSLFGSRVWQLLMSAQWRVDASSNRVGVRLAGPSLLRIPGPELPSEPTLPGAIQVPGNGQPIALGPDGPVTGGYPVIGVVAADGLDRLAQLRPGETVRLCATVQ